MKKLTALLMTSAFLSACSSTLLLTETDISAAESDEQLNKLYQSIRQDLGNSKASSEIIQNRQLYLPVVGRKIATIKEQEILDRLEHDLSKHTIDTLTTELNNAAQIEQYHRETYLELTMQLQKAIDEKEREIREKQFQFQSLDDSYAVEKVRLLEAISQIFGGIKAQATQQQLTDYIDELYDKAQQALTSKRNNDVKTLIENLLQITPDDERLAAVQHSLIIAEYEQLFWDTLSRGKTDEAFEAYKRLIFIPDYIKNHVDIVPVAEDMIRYFVTAGNKAMADFAVAPAYQLYSKANYVKESLKREKHFSDGEQNFLEYVANKLLQAIAQENWAVAYGLLFVLNEFQSEHYLWEVHRDNVNKAVLEAAAFKLVSREFSNVEKGSNLGRKVMELVQQKTQALANKRVIYVQDYIYQPNRASVYTLTGEILSAKVSQVGANVEEKKSVLISHKAVENPDYITWSNLNKRERKQVVEPAMILEEPIYGDVSIRVTRYEKNASLSLNYRLEDVSTKRIVLEDAISKEKIAQDDSVEGVRYGLFVQDAKQAQLPDNITLLNELIELSADDITKSIFVLSDKLLEKYKKLGTQAVVAENFNNAAAYYAYAYALTQAQHQADDDLLEKLKTYAIRWK